MTLGEPLIDAGAVAAHLSMSKAAVYRLAASGALPSVTVGPRLVRFRPEDIRVFIALRARRASSRGRVQQLLGTAP